MTLLEVLVGLALVVVLLGAMAWFISDLVDTRDRLAAASARDGSATAIFERLESDLAFTVTADAGISGVRGDATSLALLTRGVLLADATSRLGDLQRQEYRFEARRRSLIGSRAEVIGGSVGPGASHPMLDGHLERVRFRYHDGRAWQESFDSRRDGGLPTLVEVALWWAPRRAPGDDGDDEANGLDELDQFPDDDLDAPDNFADFDDDDRLGVAIERGRVRESLRAPDRLRVIRIPDARPVDPDAVPLDDSGSTFDEESA